VSWDNRQFNVNGREVQDLADALSLVFRQNGIAKAEAYKVDPKKGLILLWADTEGTKLPTPMDAAAVLPMVQAWLESDEADTIELDSWDRDADHDGHNGPGWRVYCEKWGHVGDCHYAICAIKKVFLWYGK
jgi:hypothetical protein